MQGFQGFHSNRQKSMASLRNAGVFILRKKNSSEEVLGFCNNWPCSGHYVSLYFDNQRHSTPSVLKFWISKDKKNEKKWLGNEMTSHSMHWCSSFFQGWPCCLPKQPFHIFRVSKSVHQSLLTHKVCLLTDFEALILWQGRSGNKTWSLLTMQAGLGG